ncbi:MAG: hypothetical protein ABIA21_01450 [Candidatus Aenigmatarchaeota archaeon]
MMWTIAFKSGAAQRISRKLAYQDTIGDLYRLVNCSGKDERYADDKITISAYKYISKEIPFESITVKQGITVNEGNRTVFKAVTNKEEWVDKHTPAVKYGRDWFHITYYRPGDWENHVKEVQPPLWTPVSTRGVLTSEE